MATERIDVVVTERGARVVQRNIESIGNQAQKTDSAVRLMKRTLGLLAGAIGVRQIVDMVDTYTNLQNRLKMVTTSTGNLANVTGQLFDIANKTRSSFQGTAELYSRVSLATKEYGLQQSELLKFTERVNMAVILSGASAAEASAGLIQFSQGLASGTLRGDELRSVLEQMPAIADVIVTHMNKVGNGVRVTRGELRELGAQGKITTQLILAAFRDSDAVAEAFAKTVPTIGQAFVVLKNQTIRFLGEFDKATGASETFARAIIAIAVNMRQFVAGIVTATVALAFLAGPRVVGMAITGFNLLTAAMMRNPFGLLAVGIAAAATWLLQMDDRFDKFLEKSGKTVTFVDRFVAAWAGAKAYITTVFEDLPGWFEWLGKRMSNGLVDGIEGALNWIGEKVAKLTGRGGNKLDMSDWKFDDSERSADAGQRAASAYSDAFAAVLKARATKVDPLGTNGTNMGGGETVDEKARKKAERELRQLKDAYANLVDAIDPVRGAEMRLTEAQVLLSRAREKNLLTAEQEAAYLERVAEYYQDALDPIGKMNREMGEQALLLGLSAKEREIEQQMMQARHELLGQNIKLDEAETIALRDQLKALQDLNIASQVRESLLAGSVGQREGFTSQVDAAKALSADPTSGFTKGDGAKLASEALDGMGIDITNFQSRLDAQYDALATYHGQVDELRKAGLISEQEHASAGLQIELKKQAVLLGTSGSFFKQMEGLQSSNSRKVAAIGKAAAIAGAVIDTYKAATGAYASMAAIPVVGPALGVAAAAAAVAAGMANVAAIRSQPTGFMSGGYTGDGGTSQVAGVVHGQEFVANAAATRRNRPLLEAMNSGASVGGATELNVTINNQIPGATFDVQQMDDGRVEVIARRVVREEADGVTATNIRDPNSRTSKSLAQNTKTTRSF